MKSVLYFSHSYGFIDYTCKWYLMIFVFLCLSSLTWGDGFLVHHAADSTPVSLCFTLEWCFSCRCTALSSLFFHWTFWWIPCLAYWKSAALKIKVLVSFWMVIFCGPRFPDSSVAKESACSVGDPSSIPATGRSAAEGMGYPLQYSWASFVACNVGDPGLIPGLGRSPGEGKAYPLQWSGLENSMDCIVHSVAKCWMRLSDFHFTFSGPRPTSGIAGSYDTSMSHISWKLHAVFS